MKFMCQEHQPTDLASLLTCLATRGLPLGMGGIIFMETSFSAPSPRTDCAKAELHLIQQASS